MGQIRAIIAAKLRMGRHEIVSVRSQSRLKVSVVSVAFFTLWLGAYVLFKEGFNYLLIFGGSGGGEFSFGDILMGRLLHIFAISLMFLLTFSNILVAFATMYKSKEVVYLLQAPIRFDQFFYARFFECVTFSSWALAFLGSPLFLAYGLTTDASVWFYIAALVFYIPFVVLPAAIGSMITMILVQIFPRLKTRLMVTLAILGAIGFFLYIGGVLRETEVDDDALLPTILNASARAQSPFFPSTWTADGILAASNVKVGESLSLLGGVFSAPFNEEVKFNTAGNRLFYSPAGVMLYNFCLLSSCALMALWLAGLMAQRIFYSGWSCLMGQDKQRIKPEAKGILNTLQPLLNRVREPARSLIIKDIKLFWRDPTQWSQFVIFFGIMAIYLANLRNSSSYYEEDKWRSWIACLNVGAVSLILATLTSRFVFPLVSLEGRRFWILGLAPLTFKQLVWQKFWLSVITCASFTVPLALLSGSMLQLEPVYFFMTVFSIVVCNFGLSGLAVGLGTLYPVFTEDNPARIVSGMGGTLNLLVSVGYITLVVAAQVMVLQWNALGLFENPQAFWVALGVALISITSITACCILIPMRLGLKTLMEMEF